jgi:hypothetical protein
MCDSTETAKFLKIPDYQVLRQKTISNQIKKQKYNISFQETAFGSKLLYLWIKLKVIAAINSAAKKGKFETNLKLHRQDELHIELKMVIDELKEYGYDVKLYGGPLGSYKYVTIKWFFATFP